MKSVCGLCLWLTVVAGVCVATGENTVPADTTSDVLPNANVVAEGSMAGVQGKAPFLAETSTEQAPGSNLVGPLKAADGASTRDRDVALVGDLKEAQDKEATANKAAEDAKAVAKAAKSETAAKTVAEDTAKEAAGSTAKEAGAAKIAKVKAASDTASDTADSEATTKKAASAKQAAATSIATEKKKAEETEAAALKGDLGESMQFDVGSPYRKHSVNTSGVTCSSFGDTEPTENECKEGWEQLRLSTNTTSGASWSGSTSYSFMPNGCVVNTGTGIAHDGTVYFNSGAGAGPYSGRSLICKLANEQAPFTQGSFDSQAWLCKPALATSSGTKRYLSLPSFLGSTVTAASAPTSLATCAALQYFLYDRTVLDEYVHCSRNGVLHAINTAMSGLSPSTVQMTCIGVDPYTNLVGSFPLVRSSSCSTSTYGRMEYALPNKLTTLDGLGGALIGIPGGYNSIQCGSVATNFKIGTGSYVSCEAHKQVVCQGAVCHVKRLCQCLNNCNSVITGFARWSGFPSVDGATGRVLCEKLCVKM